MDSDNSTISIVSLTSLEQSYQTLDKIYEINDKTPTQLNGFTLYLNSNLENINVLKYATNFKCNDYGDIIDLYLKLCNNIFPNNFPLTLIHLADIVCLPYWGLEK